jgi:DNA-binding NarL/FixJ family response regulator
MRILLADDHRIVREGIRNFLEKQPDMDVIAEAEDGLNAMRLAEETSPDLVIMDVALPDLNGVEASKQIKVKSPKTKILALSMHADVRFVVGMLTNGASGYLLKDSALEELVNAIRSVMDNQTYLSSKIANVVVTQYFHQLESGKSAFSLLTTRERETLQLLAEGNNTNEIASKMSLSVKTIETYRQQIMNKLHKHSIAELTKYAIREGLTSVEN